MYCLIAWKMGWTKAPADENVCVIMAKTYELVNDDSASQSGDDVAPVEHDEGDAEHAIARITENTAPAEEQQRRPLSMWR